MRYLMSAAALAISAGAASAEAGDCAALSDVVFPGGYVTSAREMAAEGASPAYCEIRATALPAISVEVRLPLEGWNGKYYQAGCGGFCGVLGRADGGASWVNAMRPGLERGYATATSDSGHHGLSVVDAAWADHNPHAERDWGWRSIGETHRIAQIMIGAFYGGASEQAIFQGCSTGGRMAQMAALKYPDMFQGIIAGAPAMDYTGLVATAANWVVQANTGPDGAQILKPGKEALIGAEVMKQCDGLDGAEDGLISDPRQCHADLSALTCAGAPDESCLTPEEQGVILKWRQGAVNSAGERLYPGGVPEGSEPFWQLWLTGNPATGAPGLVPLFAHGFSAYMAFPDDPGAEWSAMDFDFDRDPPRLETMAKVYNADSPDLSAFRSAGGKMIVWHGWADAIVTPFKTVEWYDEAAEAAGGEEALGENVALFMIPGLDHCGILPGPGGVNAASLDPMTPLEAWLNDGVKPEGIMAE